MGVLALELLRIFTAKGFIFIVSKYITESDGTSQWKEKVKLHYRKIIKLKEHEVRIGRQRTRQ